MQALYPLKFQPFYKPKVWGNQNLATLLNKEINPQEKIGESWEISAVENYESVVTNGYLEGNTIGELIEVYMEELVGEKNYERFGLEFPLLIKFIDADDDLSIQVHPDDEVAYERHESYGKTEMWYVVDAKPGAKLVAGFSETITQDDYFEHLEAHTLTQVLEHHEVKKGDAFFIPAGCVHAIGKGIVLAEIQQTSDVTYRLYDYNRLDDSGNFRELHTDLAQDVINFEKSDKYKLNYKTFANQSIELAKNKFFTTNVIDLTKSLYRDYYPLDSFVILICVDGNCEIVYGDNQTETLVKGETILIPADMREITLKTESSARIIETYI